MPVVFPHTSLVSQLIVTQHPVWHHKIEVRYCNYLGAQAMGKG